jgi:hypothetical protein
MMSSAIASILAPVFISVGHLLTEIIIKDARYPSTPMVYPVTGIVCFSLQALHKTNVSCRPCPTDPGPCLVF